MPLLLKTLTKNTGTEACMNGNEKYVAALSVSYLKLLIPAALSGSCSVYEKYAAQKIHWKNSASSTLRFYEHRTLKTKQSPFVTILSEAWSKAWG